MTQINQKVALGMSGGVDSSTAALLLKQQGFEVIGITAILHGCGSSCGASAQDDAQKVCNFLGIKHQKIDLTDFFEKNIISYFLDTYKIGKTPNPCAVCNKLVKWGVLWDYAHKELGCDLFATGHYAQIEHGAEGYKLKRSSDKLKDQTYMLINLTQEDLAHTLFPLGYFEKEEIKKLASENNIPTAHRPESQDVCFIEQDETVQEFLENHFGPSPGNIIDCSTGKKIGEHNGIYNYTIGQRRGIKVPYPYPLYVVSIDTETNTIFVGAKEDIESNNLIVTEINWISSNPPGDKFFALTKIRYNSRAKLAQIELIDDNSANIAFDKAQYAITPGQVAAFYTLDNQYLLGGGWIQ